jgi:methionyl aminopeptidase
MARVGEIVKLALDEMKKEVRAGVTTQQLDDICSGVFDTYGARSAPQLAYDFPGAACISINDEAVHGIPKPTRTVESGDLIKLDVAAELDGFIADAAVTDTAGITSPDNLRLAKCPQSALLMALSIARAGRRLNLIGKTVQTEVERQGFNIIPELGGHGVGRAIHEDPFVSNQYNPWDSQRLNPGLVIAIEPVISSGSPEAYKAQDGWAIKTSDGAPSAHFEHTVVITHERPIVLTA